MAKVDIKALCICTYVFTTNSLFHSSTTSQVDNTTNTNFINNNLNWTSWSPQVYSENLTGKVIIYQIKPICFQFNIDSVPGSGIPLWAPDKSLSSWAFNSSLHMETIGNSHTVDVLRTHWRAGGTKDIVIPDTKVCLELGYSFAWNATHCISYTKVPMGAYNLHMKLQYVGAYSQPAVVQVLKRRGGGCLRWTGACCSASPQKEGWGLFEMDRCLL